MEVQEYYKKRIRAWEKAWATCLELVKDLEEDTAQKQPPSGGWSIQQVMQHLVLSESGTLQYMKRKVLDPSKLLSPNLGTYFRVVFLEWALASPLRFNAPAPAATPMLPLDESWEDSLKKITLTHENFYRFLQELDPALKLKMIFRHPFAGRMPLTGVFRFQTWHIRHHQRQIKRILAEIR